MKRTSWVLLAIIAICLPFSANAFSTKAEKSVYIGKDEIVDGNLYAAGSNITIDGTVNGDVFCAGESVNINGKVEGDVICAQQNININGKVGGSVRTAANSVNINGQIARNVMALGSSVNLGSGSTVGWDMFIGSASGEIRGKIAKDLYGSVNNLILSGQVGKNVRLRVDEGNNEGKTSGLVVTKEANVAGDFVYTSKQNANIDKEAKIKGATKKFEAKISTNENKGKKNNSFINLFSIFHLLIVGLAIVTLTKKSSLEIFKIMKEKIGQTIGWGSFFIFLTPIFSIILLITLIGAPLALISTLMWIIALIVGKPLAGIAIGQMLCEKYWIKKKDSLMTTMIVGSVFIWLLCSLPLIGFLFSLIAIIWGIGGAVIYLKNSQN